MSQHPGRYCRTDPDGIEQHSWDCDESTPLADVLSYLVSKPLDNPILEASRQAMVRTWTT